MRRRHELPSGVEQNAGKQIGQHRFIARVPPLNAVDLQFLLNLPPELLVDDLRMLAGVGRAFVDDFASIDPVSQHLVERAAREGLASIGLAIRSRPPLADHALSVERGPQLANRAEFEIASEDRPNGFSLGLVDDEFLVFDVVADRRLAAHPKSPLLRRRDLVPDPLARDLAFELGEGQESSAGPCWLWY
jgi:hypothetical protein